jgi:segregation and condensation protein B
LNLSDITQDHPRNDLALAEAALFLAPQPMTRRALAKILGSVAQTYVDQLLEDLKIQFDDANRGIELHIEEGRAMFRVKAAYVNQVAHLAPQHDIPRQELRTLAVIAYNHPMTQANLIKVRGNKGYKHVQELIERNLIASEPHGRTLLLHVTRDFLRHFGLSSVEEFRFHFPTAAEENAEALARPTAARDDSDVPQRSDQEGDNLDTPPGEVSDALESQEVGKERETTEGEDTDDIPKRTDVEGDDLEAPSIEEPEDPEPQKFDEARAPLTTDMEDVETENRTENEPNEEPSEEVEDG